jgi:4-hydroxy-tetrahydrodipicolinate synthase
VPDLASALGRVVTAMVTPFTADRELDLDGAQRLADHLVTHGTDTVLVHGTTGESPTLGDDEMWKLLGAVKEAVAGRGQVWMGTGSNDTRKAVASTRRAAEVGVDACLVVTPYYNRPSQAALVAHFTTVASVTDLPVVLYDVPARTAREIALETLVELCQIDNIAGVKDAADNLGKAAEVVAATRGAPGGFAVWCGADELNLPMLAVGARGFVSVSAHLCGSQLAEMVDVFASDPARARDLHLGQMPLHRALFAEPSPAPLKGALNRVGLPAGPVRPPLLEADEATVDAVVAALEVAGVTPG